MRAACGAGACALGVACLLVLLASPRIGAETIAAVDSGEKSAPKNPDSVRVTVDQLHQLMIVPVILGDGKRLFGGLTKPPRLELESTRRFANGNVFVSYRSG